MVDLASLSLVELQDLERVIPKEIRRRKAEDKAKVHKQLQEYAKSQGFTLDQFVSGTAPVTRRSTSKVEAKYRHPEQSDLEWSGRGRKPKWLEAWLSSGGTLEQLAI
ncbi:MAG: H-NS histone family protein [Zoogloeaceae bacterium]|jgi:DNA-binding protein H-NS|nr:H-NS histone family protein [Zoogloeaceae bacterium]